MCPSAEAGSVQSAVIAILARQAVCDPASVRPDMTPAELGLDSLGLVEALFGIEERFDITVPYSELSPDDGSEPGSVGAIVALVRALVDAR